MSRPFAEIIEEVLEVERQEAERQGDECDSAPREGASDTAIAKAEAARDRKLSDMYKEFLKTCNGWEYYSWGIHLFGTEELSGEAYDDAEETLSYTDDVPEELARALLIGKNENDATLIMLLDSGEVVDHLYEETERFADLSAYILDRKKTLIEMREAANATIAKIEREWDPEFRSADDAALAAELGELLKADRPPVPVPNPSDFVDANASPTAKPSELVVKDEDGDVGASLDLGLALYLGASPTRDEVLESFRAFREAFPIEGPLQWALADAMSFGSETSEDADAEPFADALRVDDQGFYGLRVFKGEAAGAYILNIRGIPPEDQYDDDEDDDEESGSEEIESGSGRAAGARRASFVEVLVPPDEEPAKLESLCVALTNILPVRSGHGGYFARVHDRDMEPDPWNTVFDWCRRYFGVEPCYVDGWLSGALTRHRGAGWLTVIGRPFLDALGEPSLSDAVTRHETKNGLVLTAGALSLGDVACGDFPVATAEVARLLAPVSLTTWARHGKLSMGGVWFSTFADQLPGSFSGHHATESFMQRLVHPAKLIGPSARETGLALVKRLKASMSADEVEAWSESIDLDDLEAFRDLMRALYNGAFHTPDSALQIEALEHAAQFPDWSPKQLYNNLLIRYFDAKRIDDGLALMPVALRTAVDNAYTYHSAACILVAAGRLDEAFDCVRRAKEAEYDHMDKLEVDDDLAPLRERDDYKALFSD